MLLGEVRSLDAKLARTVVITGILLIFVTPALAKRKLLNVSLAWRPTTQIGSRGSDVEIHKQTTSTSHSADSSSVTTSVIDLNEGRVDEIQAPVRIQLEKLGDTRENPQLIGENREDADDGKILQVTTKDDVAAWCTDRLRRALEQFGFDIVDEDGDVVIGGQVRRFFVAETSTYEGDVAMKIEVKSGDGKLLWSGLTSGVTNRFGGSYELENYQEVLSDSFLDAVKKLVDHEAFRRAVLEAKPKGAK